MAEHDERVQRLRLIADALGVPVSTFYVDTRLVPAQPDIEFVQALSRLTRALSRVSDADERARYLAFVKELCDNIEGEFPPSQ